MKRLMVLVFMLACIMLMGCGKSDTPGTSTEVNTSVPISYGESYIYGIDEGMFSIYVGGKVIAEDKIGDKIEEVSLTAGWKNNSDGTWDSQETLRGEVYTINGISNDVAVALKFIDKGEAVTTTHYYVIMNPNADLTSVEEYVIPPLTPNSIYDE